MEDPCSDFLWLYPSLDCLDQDIRLYTEVVDGRVRKRIYPVSENMEDEKKMPCNHNACIIYELLGEKGLTETNKAL